MWTLMCDETNLYAEQRFPVLDDLPPHSVFRKWTPVSVDEMKVFIALSILMGLVKKPDLDDYWTTDPATSTPMFSKHMTRDRFMSILSNFHLSDNTQQAPRGTLGFDPLSKVKPFITMMQRSFAEVYTPEQHLSFDEASCPWKGRLSWKCYNPRKPNKFHIKLYTICEASSGYVCGFDIYTGRTACQDFADILELNEECGITTRVVTGLLAFCGLLSKGYFVFMDNFYSSPELYEELNYLDTYACGTVRKNRKELPKALEIRLAPGDTIFRRRDNLLAVKHHDKRDIHMLSTIHRATYVAVDVRNKDGTEAQALKPTCIFDYVKRMGGVDVSDQMLQYYSVFRKSNKYWRKLFFHLLNMIITNSYVLFKKYGDSPNTDHYHFRLALVYKLLEEAIEAPQPKGRGRKSTTLEDCT